MKRGGPNHPKTVGLAARLKLRRYAAAGLLECLWHFAQVYARRGDVGRFTDAEIAAHLDYDGDPEEMVNALVAARFLDRCECHRLRIHDWPEHADQALKRTTEIDKHGFLACYSSSSSGLPESFQQTTSGLTEDSATAPVPATVPEPVTVPVNGNGPRANPLVAGRRGQIEGEALRLTREIAQAEGRDPLEVMAQAADYPGASGPKVNTATMTDDRLANTVRALRRRRAALEAKQSEAPDNRAFRLFMLSKDMAARGLSVAGALGVLDGQLPGDDSRIFREEYGHGLEDFRRALGLEPLHAGP